MLIQNPPAPVTGNTLLTGLRACYEMDEGTGLIMYDETSHYDGSYAAGVTHSTSGILDECIYLNGGTTSFASIPLSTLPSPSAGFTIAYWVKPTSNPAVNFSYHIDGLHYVSSGTYRGFCVRYSDYLGNPRFEFLVAPPTSLAVAVTYPGVVNGNWYHIVVSYDGANSSKMYVDGVLIGTHTATTLTNPLTHAYYIGKFEYGSARTFWSIAYHDQTAFWDVELSQENITSLYNSGAGIPYSSFA